MLPLPTPGPNATPAERDVHRLWTLVNEILEQLERQKSVAEKLRAEVLGMKDQASRVADGGVGLKRCNVDLSKEHLTSEMERFSAALVMENQTLLHEHKQLRMLLREYEGTLETVMGKFRGVCYAAPTHQHTLTRHYETLLMQEQVRMEQMQRGEPRVETMLASLGVLVKAAIMSLEGKDPAEGGNGGSPEREKGQEEEESQAREAQASCSLEPLDDWANTRELEIARLQEENTLLRKGLYISPEYDDTYGFKGGNWGVVGAGVGWNRGGGGVYATGYGAGYSPSPGGWYGEYVRGGVAGGNGFGGGGGHLRRGSGGAGGGGRGGGVGIGRGAGPGPGAGMGMGIGMGAMRRPGLTAQNQNQPPPQAQTRSVFGQVGGTGLFGAMMGRTGSPPPPPPLQEQEVEVELEGGDGERRWREGRGLS